MRRTLRMIGKAMPVLLLCLQTSAQTDSTNTKLAPANGTSANTTTENPRKERTPIQGDTIKRKKLTLVFADNDNTLSTEFKQWMIETYFKQYPKLIKKYNRESPKLVTFFLDKDYKGVAAAGGGVIRYNPTWFHKNPEDIDVVTHELMHIVQGYGYTNVPSWVTEGIADYVRATEGINNEKANWKMPDLKPEHKYSSSYRITARFFLWITQNYKKDFVKKLDDAARQKTYSDATWKKLTGKTLDELWQEYLSNPALK